MSDITVGSIKIQAILDGKPALVGLDKLTKKMKGLQKPVKTANKMFGKMLKIAGFAGFTKMDIDAGKFGRAMGILADKTGIAASKITSMRNSFAAMGGSAKSIDNLLNNLSTGIARLSMGDGSMAATLSSMNISAWDNNGRLKKADVLQGEIADWAKQQKALGRSFAEVAAFLKDNFGIEEDLARQMYTLGHGGMEAQRKKIEAQTGRLTDNELANLQRMNQAFSKLTVTVEVLFQKIAAGLAPVIDFVIEVFTSLAKMFQDVWGEVIEVFKIIFGEGEELAELLEFIKYSLHDLAVILKLCVQTIGLVVAAFKKLGEWIGNFIAWVQSKLGFGGSTEELKGRALIEDAMRKQMRGEISTEALGKILKAQGVNPKMAQAIYSGNIDKWQNMVRKGEMTPEEYQKRIGIEKKEPVYVYDENGVLKAVLSSVSELPDINLSVSNTVNKDGTVNTEVTSDGGNVKFTGMVAGSNNSGNGS